MLLAEGAAHSGLSRWQHEWRKVSGKNNVIVMRPGAYATWLNELEQNWESIGRSFLEQKC